ncbi:MAG: hypothetical protein ACLU6O_03735 [Bilophila wadsworthia]
MDFADSTLNFVLRYWSDIGTATTPPRPSATGSWRSSPSIRWKSPSRSLTSTSSLRRRP